MMYEFHKGDVKTVNKYKRIDAGRSIDRKTVESVNERSLQSSKGNPPSINSNDDINPQLGSQDTPVSGVKVLKPGSRRKQAAHNSTSPIPSNKPFDDREVDHQLKGYQGQGRSKAEVRFREGLVEEEEIRKQLYQEVNSSTLPKSRLQAPLKSSISPRVQTNRTNIEEAIDSRGYYHISDNEALHRSLQHNDRPASLQGKAKTPLSRNNLSQDDGNTFEEDHRQLQKSKSRDMIRNDSIQRLKKVTAVNSNSTRLGRSLSRKRPKTELTDKFFFLREKKRADKGASRNSSPEPRNPPRATISTQEVLAEEKNLDLHERENTDINIDEVTHKKIELLHDWLKDLGYLKYYNTQDELPNECRNGSLFFKIINHLERSSVLKGENTSSKTAIRVNFEKIFAYLKKFEKFNPRYLNSEYYLMKGQKEVFWGFTDDIQHVYGNKISFKDKRFNKRASKQDQSRDPSRQRRDSGLSYSQSPKVSRSGSRQHLKQPALKTSTSQKDSLHPSQSKQKLKLDKSPAHKPQRAKHNDNESISSKPLSSLPRKEAAAIQSIPSFSRFVDLENTTNKNLRKLRVDSNNLAELEDDCKEWFEVLGYRINYRDTMFENQLRNGFMLCTIVALVFKKPIKKVCKDPKSVSECRNNIESALNVIRAANSPIPYELLWQGDEILKGNPSVTWQLFSSLKYLHMTGSATDSNVNLNKAANLSSINMKVLPYTESQIAKLSKSLLGWLISLGVFNTDLRLPTCIEDVIEQVSQGAVLAKVVFKVTGQVLRGIHVKPRSRPNYVFNVSKCLDYLKTVPNMSRKFLWKTEDIVNCLRLPILGLLEDIHLLAEGHPQRKDPNYFIDGPYIIDVDLTELLKRQNKPQNEENSRLHSELGVFHGSEANQHLNNLNQFKLSKAEQRKAPSDDEILQIINNKQHSSKLDNRQLRDPKTLQQIMDERPSEFEIQPLNNTFGPVANQTEPLAEAEKQGANFEQIKRVIRLLLTLNLPKVVERESWNSSLWTLFSDG